MAARLISTVGSPSNGRGKWIVIAISGPPRLTWSRSDGRRRFSKNHDRGAIISRSGLDRDAIGIPKRRNQDHAPSYGFERRPLSTKLTIVVRSWPDRGTIVARSGLLFEEKLKLTHRRIQATTYGHGIAPTKPWNRLHDRFNWPRSSDQFPSLNACISLLCSSTFDRFMKELSEFRARSLVHHDPTVFRLDYEAIGAGLIRNFSMISSNFSLEFRTSTRKNPSKFASIHENWSPILAAIGLVVRFDRLSGGNLSF